MLNILKFEQILDGYVRQKDMSPQTQRYYISCMRAIDRKLREAPQDAERSNRISPRQIEDSIIALCKNNAQVSKYIAAVKKYEKEVNGREKTLLYGEPLTRLTTFCKTPEKGKPLALPEATYAKKYNRLGNKKLKLAFRLQEKSGLRVSELADLQPDDVLFNEDHTLTVQVRNGKGRKARTVQVLEDQYLYEHLQEYIQSCDPNKRIFYTEAYLRKKAGEYDIPTHDLRRTNARKRYRTELDKGQGKRSAKQAVARELGHENVATTNIYIYESENDENC